VQLDSKTKKMGLTGKQAYNASCICIEYAQVLLLLLLLPPMPMPCCKEKENRTGVSAP
jgi:hypothetical protein